MADAQQHAQQRPQQQQQSQQPAPSALETLRTWLRGMTVNQLKLALEELGLSKTGNKGHLQQRLLDCVEGSRPLPVLRVLDALRNAREAAPSARGSANYVYRSSPNSASPHSQNTQQHDHVSPIHNRIASASATINRSDSSSSGQNSQQILYQNLTQQSSQSSQQSSSQSTSCGQPSIMNRLQQQAQQQQAQQSITIKFVGLPFLSVKKVYSAPKYINNSSSGLLIEFDSKEYTDLCASKADPSSISLRLFIGRFTRENADRIFIEYPETVSFYVNNYQIPHNAFMGLRKKPHTARPLDLTPYLIETNPQKLRLDCVYSVNTYVAIVVLVEHISVETLVDQIKSTKCIPKQTVMENRRRMEEEDGIVATLEQVSLKDPQSKCRIVAPIRARTCTHLQCFDCYTYLMLNSNIPTWECPVCYKSAHYDTLIFDEYFEEILDQCGDVDVVDVLPDGTWKLTSTSGPDCVPIGNTKTEDGGRRHQSLPMQSLSSSSVNANQQSNSNHRATIGGNSDPNVFWILDDDEEPEAVQQTAQQTHDTSDDTLQNVSSMPQSTSTKTTNRPNTQTQSASVAEVIDLTLSDSDDEPVESTVTVLAAHQNTHMHVDQNMKSIVGKAGVVKQLSGNFENNSRESASASHEQPKQDSGATEPQKTPSSFSVEARPILTSQEPEQTVSQSNVVQIQPQVISVQAVDVQQDESEVHGPSWRNDLMRLHPTREVALGLREHSHGRSPSSRRSSMSERTGHRSRERSSPRIPHDASVGRGPSGRGRSRSPPRAVIPRFRRRSMSRSPPHERHMYRHANSSPYRHDESPRFQGRGENDVHAHRSRSPGYARFVDYNSDNDARRMHDRHHRHLMLMRRPSGSWWSDGVDGIRRDNDDDVRCGISDSRKRKASESWADDHERRERTFPRPSSSSSSSSSSSAIQSLMRTTVNHNPQTASASSSPKIPNLPAADQRPYLPASDPPPQQRSELPVLPPPQIPSVASVPLNAPLENVTRSLLLPPALQPLPPPVPSIPHHVNVVDAMTNSTVNGISPLDAHTSHVVSSLLKYMGP